MVHASSEAKTAIIDPLTPAFCPPRRVQSTCVAPPSADGSEGLIAGDCHRDGGIRALSITELAGFSGPCNVHLTAKPITRIMASLLAAVHRWCLPQAATTHPLTPAFRLPRSLQCTCVSIPSTDGNKGIVAGDCHRDVGIHVLSIAKFAVFSKACDAHMIAI